jgi:hypothetical protein
LEYRVERKKMLAAAVEALDKYVAWLEEERKEDDEEAAGEEKEAMDGGGLK